jgi:hypothetical protein
MKLSTQEPPLVCKDHRLRREIVPLPSIEQILTLCSTREDFPRHIMQNTSRRRSIIKEFLLNGDDTAVKRSRAFSMDDKHRHQLISWYHDKPMNIVGKRRHSMFETTNCMKNDLKRGGIRPWSTGEDVTLLKAVRKYGSNWTKVCEELPYRITYLMLGNRRQCKEHWYRVLSKRSCAQGIDPDRIFQDPFGVTSELEASQEVAATESSKRGLWSEEEDMQLLQAYHELGPRWHWIANRVPGRNQKQCEKRYRRIKKAKEESKSPSDLISTLSTLADVASHVPHAQGTLISCQ